MAEYPNIAVLPTPYPPAGQIVPQNGVVAGGKLRPGAIDQAQFQKLLQAQIQQQNQAQSAAEPAKGMTLADYRKLAGIQVASATTLPAANPPPALPSAPVTAPSAARAPSDGIPTLSLEQFAALTGMTLPESAPLPPAAPAGPGQIAVQIATSPGDTADAAMPEDLVTEGLAPDDMPAEMPAEEAAPAAVNPEGLADGTPVDVPEEATAAPPKASSEETAPDSRLVLLDSYPDREEQKRLTAQGKHWALKETPGARELFLGPDGKFGWDDFVDIINPLQHIPVVAQVYRAVTGDQAYGLSNFIGAIPFGALSIASAVADTVIRSQTGRDAGTDLAARILGVDNRTPEEANLHLVQPGYGTADEGQLASAAGESLVQVADASVAQPAAAAHAWNRDSAGISRD